ncbi:hypothetical protein [Brevundimonas bacteroides]|uniref:hypothetical protein n=1 Tax=Brevundimonas bacteroides TaxID=74311 RepID=UPI0004971C06|nr:hypothetical protein [Brevundimonas bacteroides]
MVEEPILNRIAFGVGMGAVIFWPAWLMSAVTGALCLVRREPRVASLLLGLAATPLAVLGLFTVLINRGAEIETAGSIQAIGLDGAAWVFLISSVLCIAVSAGVWVRWTLHRLGRREPALRA